MAKNLVETAAADTLRPNSMPNGTATAGSSRSAAIGSVVDYMMQMDLDSINHFLETLTQWQGTYAAADLPDDAADKNRATLLPKGSPVGPVGEEVKELFDGEELSEEFKSKALTIFEAAVKLKVADACLSLEEQYETAKNEMQSEFEKKLEEQLSTMSDYLAENLNSYLDYAVGEWMRANEVPLVSKLKLEMNNAFISGLKDLFMEHYYDIPDDKVDVVEEMSNHIESIEKQLSESLLEIQSLHDEINNREAESVFNSVCEGMTVSQIEKMTKLTEGIEYDNFDDLRNKLSVIKESFAASDKKIVTTSSVNDIDEEIVVADNNVKKPVNGAMSWYVKALTNAK